MLPKRYRLKSPGLFRQVLTPPAKQVPGQQLPKAQRRQLMLGNTPLFKVLALRHRPEIPEAHRQTTQFGLVVSKKVDKRATRRNRIKRRFREILRTTVLPQYTDVLNNYQAIVIIAHGASVTASYAEMTTLLLQCLNRVR